MDRMKMAPAADPAAVARDFAKTLHDRWGVGDRACNNGVLLLLAVQDRQVTVTHPCHLMSTEVWTSTLDLFAGHHSIT